MFISEIFYPADAESASQSFKVVRLACNFRSERITNPDVELRATGFYGAHPDVDKQKYLAERASLLARMQDIEAQLVGCGVPATSIVRIGVAQGTVSAGQIMFSSGLLKALTLPSVQPSLYQTTGILPPPDIRPSWQDNFESEGSVGYDPAAKEITTEVSIKYKLKGVLVAKSIGATFSLSPDGRLKEVTGELIVFKKTIAEDLAKGFVKDLVFAVKATSTFELEKEELKNKFKAVVSADLGIPGTRLKIGTEVSGYVDPVAGKPGAAVNFTLVSW